MLQNIEFIGVFCEGAAFGTAPLTSKKDKLQNKESNFIAGKLGESIYSI